jgi:hypothetical protein
MAVFTDTCSAVDCNVVINDSTFSDLYIFVDAREMSDSYGWMKLCIWMNKISHFIVVLIVSEVLKVITALPTGASV